MSTFKELQDDAYFWLGTNDRNAAFPRAQIKRLLNMAKDALYQDCLRSFPDAYQVVRTLAADLTDPTSYVLASQTPAIVDPAMLLEVRLTDSSGAVLTEVPFSERFRWNGLTYAITGIAPNVVLWTGSNVRPSIPLYIVYAATAVDLVGDDTIPSWLPGDFHDVLSLRAAKLASTSGNEQTISPDLRDTLQDREAQLRLALGRRSLSVITMRVR